jgi:predicted nucleic acid-binding Zn ribbon protein
MEPLAQAIPGGLAELLRDAPLSPGKVDFAWKAAVGPAMQRVSAVRLENGVLLVEAETRHWAKEIVRASHVILPRLQTLLGQDTVHAIQVRNA